MYKKRGCAAILLIVGVYLWVKFNSADTDSPDPSSLEANYMTALTNERGTSSEYDPAELNLHEAFSQPYYYLSHGASSVAFLSEDRNYVLKVFKMRDTKTEEEVRERLGGYALANRYRKKESGIIMWHDNKTDDLKTELKILDKIGVNRNTKVGIWKTLDLDSTIFVLQRKVEKIDKQLFQALSKGEVEEARKILNVIFLLYMEEYRNGIMDIDGANFLVNIGFYDSSPIRFDVSHLRRFPNGIPPKVIEKFKSAALKSMMRWIQKRDFESHTEIMQDTVIWLSNFPPTQIIKNL